MWERFRTEMINSGIDLGLCRIRLDNNVLAISSRLGGIRTGFSLIFGLPFLYLLWTLLTTMSLVTFLTFLVFGPALAIVAVVIGCACQEIIFDRADNTITKRLRILNYAHEEKGGIPAAGRVTLSSKWQTSSSGSGNWKYQIATGIEGGKFTVFNNYYCALAYAKKLADFLDFELDNNVKPDEIR